jgi:hypothetical protein
MVPTSSPYHVSKSWTVLLSRLTHVCVQNRRDKVVSHVVVAIVVGWFIHAVVGRKMMNVVESLRFWKKRELLSCRGRPDLLVVLFQ